MSDFERSEAIQRRYSRKTVVAGYCIGAPVPVAGILFGAVEVAGKRLSAAQQDRAFWVAFVISCLVLVLAPAVSILLMRDYRRRESLITKEVRHGELPICEGPTVHIAGTGVSLNQLRKRTMPNPHSVIEVFRDSGLVWTIDGRAASVWAIVSQGITAPAPKNEGTPLAERQLSKEEADELATHIGQSRRRQRPILTGAGLIAILRFASHAQSTSNTWWLVAAFSSGAIAYGLRYREGKKLAADLAEATVVFKFRQGAFCEVPPRSGRDWTRAGMPSAWRRTGDLDARSLGA